MLVIESSVDNKLKEEWQYRPFWLAKIYVDAHQNVRYCQKLAQGKNNFIKVKVEPGTIGMLV